MIRPSPEIEAVVRRWTESIRNHQVEDLPHYLTQSDALTYIGTSRDELWRGQLVRDGISDHMAEVPDFTEIETEIEAFENGETGWASYRSTFHFPGTGATGTHRATFVFVMERGSWKMIQHHISQADSNVEKLGVEHSAFRSLIAAARENFHLDQRTGMGTVMFTDIVGSSALAEALGDSAWAALIAQHFAQVTGHVQGAKGQLVKSLGDGTMSSFPSASAALGAAHAVQQAMLRQTEEPHLQLRIGMHTGDVIQTADDFFGAVVNKAARITAAANPGDILLSDATRLMVGGADGSSFGEPERIQLKGLPGDHVVHRLTL